LSFIPSKKLAEPYLIPYLVRSIFRLVEALSSDFKINQILNWKPLFKPYLIHYFEKGGSGADIGPLKESTNVLAGLRPDSQRYFDHHHAANDTFDAVNKRELELGAATMTSLV